MQTQTVVAPVVLNPNPQSLGHIGKLNSLRRVLYIESDTQLGFLIRSALELDAEIDIRCANCSDLLAAMEAIEKDQPHLLILDLGPDAHSAGELLRSLRSDPRHMHLPVVLIYEFPLPTGAANAFDYAVGLIRKPIDVVHLPGQLRSLWEGRPK